MAGRPIRLGKAAGELNVGLPTIIEFLSSKGITIDTNPNTKLDKEHYELLCDEFAADQDLKEKSKGVITNREKRESLSIRDTKKEEAPVVKEEPHLNAEEIKRKVAEEESPPKTDSGLKVVGNIDLNALKPKKKADEKKVDTTKAESVAEKKDEVAAVNPELEKEAEVKKEQEESSDSEEVETVKVERKKITGPTVLGKIELPAEKQKSAGSSKAENANKRKRKRIKKVETPPTGAKSGNSKHQTNKPQKAEISEKDIQKEIKDTLARLSNKGGKSKASKNRRQKR